MLRTGPMSSIFFRPTVFPDPLSTVDSTLSPIKAAMVWACATRTCKAMATMAVKGYRMRSTPDERRENRSHCHRYEDQPSKVSNDGTNCQRRFGTWARGQTCNAPGLLPLDSKGLQRLLIFARDLIEESCFCAAISTTLSFNSIAPKACSWHLSTLAPVDRN
jgi:hypothetical protein